MTRNTQKVLASVCLVVVVIVYVAMTTGFRTYTCNNTSAQKTTIEIAGFAVINEMDEENEVTKWIRTIYPEPLEYSWCRDNEDSYQWIGDHQFSYIQLNKQDKHLANLKL